MDVFVNYNKGAAYPSSDWDFSPDEYYPEYPWDKSNLSTKPNHIYNMVRDSFRGMHMDNERYGEKEWNPLGSIIKKGDTVLIKPNWVMHEDATNPAKELDCIVTNASVIRAVLDYVTVALKGTGRIILGDAPLQGCNLDKLMERAGYNRLLDFYKKQGVKIEVYDFRQCITEVRNGVLYNVRSHLHEDNDYIAVDVGNYSCLSEVACRKENWRVTNYDCSLMQTHHNEKKHEYLIHRAILDADVVINLPKPKTHRKAGITSALKNFIGINGNKDWLPHHTKGSKEEGGDEYLEKNVFKKIASNLIEAEDKLALSGKHKKALIIQNIGLPFRVAGSIIGKDKYTEGSWYGNDTIWRTTLDLNRIILYADKSGIIRNERQRKYMAIGDMIISGEGEGPLHPDPKPLGVMIFSNDPAAFDAVVARIMGFNIEKLPTVYRVFENHELPITNLTCDDITLASNMQEWNSVKLKNISFPGEWRFNPSAGWKGHIELENLKD